MDTTVSAYNRSRYYNSSYHTRAVKSQLLLTDGTSPELAFRITGHFFLHGSNAAFSVSHLNCRRYWGDIPGLLSQHFLRYCSTMVESKSVHFQVLVLPSFVGLLRGRQ